MQCGEAPADGKLHLSVPVMCVAFVMKCGHASSPQMQAGGPLSRFPLQQLNTAASGSESWPRPQKHEVSTVSVCDWSDEVMRQKALSPHYVLAAADVLSLVSAAVDKVRYVLWPFLHGMLG